MNIIERNGPQSAEQIKVEDYPAHGQMRILNQETRAFMSHGFTPTAANIQALARECFEAGRRAKAREIREALGDGK
jgi:hypothetical protein